MFKQFWIEINRAAIYSLLPGYLLFLELQKKLMLRSGSKSDKLRKINEKAAKIKTTLFGYGKPVYSDISQIYTSKGKILDHQFPHPDLGQPSGIRVQDILIIDNFYEDPDAVRNYALSLNYVPYAFYKGKPFWYSSALEVKPSPINGKGIRLANSMIKTKLSNIIQSDVDDDTWDTSGDGWNGAFHYKIRSHFPGATSQIHNHAGRDSDVSEGWSGVLYLNKNSKSGAGTTIWRNKKTGLCYSNDSVYTLNHDEYELALNIENRYNRLVLFYASIFHVGEEGFGTNINNARLFQTFFFNLKRPGNMHSS